MALPPSPMPPAAGAAPPDMSAPPSDMPMDDAGGDDGWEMCCTIMTKPSTGEFKLIEGDEPEPADAGGVPGAEAPAGGEGQVFASAPELMRALMPVLDSGTAGAEDAFIGASKGGAPKPDMPMPG